MATITQLKAMLEAPRIGEYENDPLYIAAAQAVDDLLARTRGVKDLSRDDRRLFARYSKQMDDAMSRAEAAHDAYLADRGLLETE